jgi:hypothetical protein
MTSFELGMPNPISESRAQALHWANVDHQALIDMLLWTEGVLNLRDHTFRISGGEAG